MMNPSNADDQLADALWWLKGFAAAQPIDDRGETLAMAESLRLIRDWLDRLSQGFDRLLGQNEHTFACVLTEHEIEVIIDGLRSDVGEDRKIGLEKALAIYKHFDVERRKLLNSRNSEVPF